MQSASYPCFDADTRFQGAAAARNAGAECGIE